MGEKIVIIGGVAAGPKAACRARRLMPDAEITILDQDSLISYGGCGIPYYISGDVNDEDELRKTSPQANFYGVNEMGGLHVLYILDNNPDVWGLPTDPNLPPTTVLHDILEWVGMALVPAVIAGFGFNYLVSRIRIAREAKRERS